MLLPCHWTHSLLVCRSIQRHCTSDADIDFGITLICMTGLYYLDQQCAFNSIKYVHNMGLMSRGGLPVHFCSVLCFHVLQVTGS